MVKISNTNGFQLEYLVQNILNVETITIPPQGTKW